VGAFSLYVNLSMTGARSRLPFKCASLGDVTPTKR
jgi:hypothetical protein